MLQITMMKVMIGWFELKGNYWKDGCESPHLCQCMYKPVDARNSNGSCSCNGEDTSFSLFSFFGVSQDSF